ncbi:MAG: glycosyltransferase family 39 protein [Bacteroidetes bacterium]|nr:glycosyltransferase family 39 protein [Bacteroidota bacterium]
MKKDIKKKKHSSVLPSPSSAKKRTETTSAFSQFIASNNFYFLLLAVLVLLVSSIRWRLAGMPLERDEGEYAYFGHLILKGIPPYSEAYNMKLPGIYYMYALIMAVFGESFKGIHIGLLIMNAGTMLLLFSAFKRFFNPMTGLITAGFYGLMAITFNVLGFAAHATHFAVFYVALSLFLAPFNSPEGGKQQSSRNIRIFLFGISLGFAFLMKQQAVYFILFGGIVFVSFEVINAGGLKSFFKSTLRGVRGAVLFSLGVFVPYLLVVLIMLASGTFDKFWFWTVQYASKYASGLPWSQGKDLLDMTFAPIWTEFKWIWILAIAGCVVVLLPAFSMKQKILAIAFAVFAALATTPGFYFRQHYFIVALPAAALLASIALDYAGRWTAEKIKIKLIGILFPLIVFAFLYNNIVTKSKFFYADEDPVALCKAIYGTNPFVESVEIANYIKANSSDTDKIAVLGSEPQIPFYANRKSATGHIYTYGLMEIHEYNLKMQEEMIAEIEKAKPLFLVFCNVPFSWLSKPNSPMKIFEWYNKYATENYNIVGLVDIPDQGPSSYYWNADAQRQPKNKNSVWVFKRKEKITQ